MAFHIGQKVQAIPLPDGIPNERNPNAAKVYVGSVYVIRDIDARTVPLYGFASLRFEGVINPTVWHPHTGPFELAYDARCFRPVIERKSSTQTGFEILDEIRKRETIDAPLSDHQSAGVPNSDGQ